MNKIIFLLTLLCHIGFSNAQTQQDKTELSLAINQIIEGFATKDATKINAFVNPDLGIGVIYKSQNHYSYLNLEEMDFSQPFPFQKSYWEIPKNQSISFERTPGYNPRTKLWSSYGTFCQIDSPMVLFYLDEFGEQGTDLSDQAIFKLNQNTENTAFVVLADKKSNGLQFVLTKIDNQWTLTFFDLLNIKSNN